MNHGSLFSGIGGFDLAAEWMGWENVFHCEWNDFGKRILKYYWPKAISYDDITKTDFTIHRGNIDILTGGFPCQPYSAAGKRLGKEDDRHLWPEMLRAIREIQPKWIVGENVLGLVNWNGGLVFEEVQADLEAEGYEVQPYVLPAVSVNAPHRRDRIWFVAYFPDRIRPEHGLCARGQVSKNRVERGGITSNSTSNRRTGKRPAPKEENRKKRSGEDRKLERGSKGFCSNRDAANSSVKGLERSAGSSIQRECFRSSKCSNGNVTNSNRQERCQRRLYQDRSEKTERHACSCNARSNRGGYWQNFPTQPPVRTGNDGFSSESLRQLIREDSMGYLSEKEIDKIFQKANSKWRKESLMAGGNAVVPQIPYQIFKAIEKYKNL